MLVVADTSPLNYLVAIDLAEILRELYGRVVIPHEVVERLLDEDSKRVYASAAPPAA